METKETAAAYDALAAHWNDDQFNRENGIAQHLRAIRFCQSKDKAIDIGCGSSGRIIDLLLEAGFCVEGLDISAEMIRLARLRHPAVAFHQADILDFELTSSYSFISAWDSVWHVPLDRQEQMLRKLCAGLKQGGVLITSSGGIDQPDEATNPFMGRPLYHSALGIPKVLEVISSAGCVCRHLEYDQPEGDDPGRHLYLIVQKMGG